MKKPSIYDIAYKIKTESYSHYFDRKTLKFFRQTLKDFKTIMSPKGNIYVYAPCYRPHHAKEGQSVQCGWSFAQYVYVEGWKDKTSMRNVSPKPDSLDGFFAYVEEN